MTTTVGIVVGSIRLGRSGAAVADRVARRAPGPAEARVVMLDLREVDLPLLTSEMLPLPPKCVSRPGVSRQSARDEQDRRRGLLENPRGRRLADQYTSPP